MALVELVWWAARLLPGTGPRVYRAAPDRTRVELRRVRGGTWEDVGPALEAALTALPGVHRAEVNTHLGHVTVWHEEYHAPAELLRTVTDFEAQQDGIDQHGAEPVPPPAPHPGDPTQWVRHGVWMGAALVGAGYATGARLLMVRPLPTVVPTVATLVDNTPVLHSLVESRLGRAVTDLVLRAAVQSARALAQQPTTLLTNAVEDWLHLREAQARYRSWQEWDERLSERPGAHRAAPVTYSARVPATPDGPVEQAANALGLLGLGTGATVGLFSGSDRALAVLRAGSARAGNLGRATFCAQLGADLSDRGALVLRPDALRRLDRVSCVVIDGGVLVTSRRMVDQVFTLDSERLSVAELTVRAHELVALTEPTVPRQRGDWSVAPLDRQAQTRLPEEVATALDHSGGLALALRLGERLAGVVTVVPEPDPLAEALVEAARPAGVVTLAASDASARRLNVSHTVARGPHLLRSIRRLQEQGHGVALVSADPAALALADVGIGVAGQDPVTPWQADLLTGPGLADACAVLRAVPLARLVSRRGTQLSLGAAALGGLLASVGPPTGAAARAGLPLIGTALFSLAMASWYAVAFRHVPTAIPIHRVPWHAMAPDTVLDQLRSSPQGLDPDEARLRGTAQQKTTDTAAEHAGLGQAVLEELANPITPALAAGAGISAAIGAVMDAALISAALVVSALLGGVQQVGAQRALRRLGQQSMVPVQLRRGGQVISVDPAGLVPGDVVELAAGDAVPADCRLLCTEGLEVDESALTGESQLVVKSVEATGQLTIADRSCMLYQGTVIAAGSAAAVVVAAGAETELGRTGRMGGAETPTTGVGLRLQSLTRLTLELSVAAGVVLLGSDLLRGQSPGQALGRAVSLAVAAVPEGLPFVATVAELAAARRLSTRGALVRNSSTIEALGRVDTLCFDKTGTLTEGRISLRRVSDGNSDQALTELGRRNRGVVAAALRATPPANGNGPLPHPTDQAVVDGAAEIGAEPEDDAPDWMRVDELHFEPSRGYHAVLGSSQSGQRLSVKGAPEVVLERCTRWSPSEEPDAEFDTAARRLVDAEVERLARQGYRILAVAERPASDRHDLDDDRVRKLRLLGLLALADPVRPTAAEAVHQLQGAGVSIVMVTGDHASTAEAIAAELNALNGGLILTGPELDELDDEDLARVLPRVSVFARVSPEQKARIVHGLQKSGRVVSVTGDGANDAPAIRLADVGIALGPGATPATREAADLVITDGAIETITAAIVEGRGMWLSVRDAVALLLGGNLGEILFTVGAGVTGSSAALNARQLLLVNLLTDALPAMAIAVRPPPGSSAEELLAEGPDTSLGTALTRHVYLRAATTAGGTGLAWLLARMLTSPLQASTVALVALVAAQIGQTLALRGRTLLVLGAGITSLLALVAIVQTPGLSRLFGCRPLAPHSWAIALGAATTATAAGLVAHRVTRP